MKKESQSENLKLTDFSFLNLMIFKSSNFLLRKSPFVKNLENDTTFVHVNP